MNLNGYLIMDGTPPGPSGGSYGGNGVGSYEDSPAGVSPTCEAGPKSIFPVLPPFCLRPGGPAQRERHEKAETPDCSPHPDLILSASPPPCTAAQSVNQTLQAKYEEVTLFLIVQLVNNSLRLFVGQWGGSPYQ